MDWGIFNIGYHNPATEFVDTSSFYHDFCRILNNSELNGYQKLTELDTTLIKFLANNPTLANHYFRVLYFPKNIAPTKVAVEEIIDLVDRSSNYHSDRPMDPNNPYTSSWWDFDGDEPNVWRFQGEEGEESIPEPNYNMRKLRWQLVNLYKTL